MMLQAIVAVTVHCSVLYTAGVRHTLLKNWRRHHWTTVTPTSLPARSRIPRLAGSVPQIARPLMSGGGAREVSSAACACVHQGFGGKSNCVPEMQIATLACLEASDLPHRPEC